MWLDSWLRVGRLHDWVGLGRGWLWGVTGGAGSDGGGVVWRLRSDAERGMAAGCMWVGGLGVVVVWVLRLRVLLGWGVSS